MKEITTNQVRQIADEISKRWRFENRNTYYNCIDTETGQQSIAGGDYNFASFHFENQVKSLYVAMIGENQLYFDWSTVGVKESNNHNAYVMQISYAVVYLLCGFMPKVNNSIIDSLKS